MKNISFDNIYGNMQMPVIICSSGSDLELFYTNAAAKMLINPQLTSQSLTDESSVKALTDFLRFPKHDALDRVIGSLERTGYVDHLPAKIFNYIGEVLTVYITSNKAVFDGQECFIFYLDYLAGTDENDLVSRARIFSAVFHLATENPDPDTAINDILSFIGETSRVSRAYIFEPTSAVHISNTYEWCARGIEPEIQNLQGMKKEVGNYDTITSGGMYVTDDVRTLPAGDRETLEAQGIKSIAIVPLINKGAPVGYIGLDDCENYRKWSDGELSTLGVVAMVLVSLIEKRENDKNSSRSLEILQTISDNIDSLIYVNTLDTNELVFVNRAISQTLGIPPERLIGQPCWKELQKDMDGACPFCPLKNMLDEDGNVIKYEYTWEFQNTRIGKWYLVRDTIIDWIDGTRVHIEVATEITDQKLYEEKLKRFASLDMMTGVFNREGGYKVIQETKNSTAVTGLPVSLVFVDLDGLKITNDTYGHDAGDDLIIRTVDIIRSHIRKSDAICRWGGDEFLIILQCDVDTAYKIIGNIQKKLDEENGLSDRPYKLSFSYGITELRADAKTTIDGTIAHADMLMYKNKMGKRRNEGGAEG